MKARSLWEGLAAAELLARRLTRLAAVRELAASGARTGWSSVCGPDADGWGAVVLALPAGGESRCEPSIREEEVERAGSPIALAALQGLSSALPREGSTAPPAPRDHLPAVAP